MSAITAKASRKMKKYAVLTREPRCFLGSLDFSWEQRKFSDITFPAGEKNRDNLPLESYSITNEHGFVPQDEKFENGGTMREADKRMYYIVSPNSFAYNPARINVGSIGYQNIGKNVIVSSLYEVFKTSEDVDDRLLWHWLKSPDFQKLIMQLQEGGVRLYFYYDKLCMGEVSLPSLEEQRKIGKLFDTLDNLITLHQRKCALLFSPFQALISMMFTTSTFSWEQRKLGDIADIVGGGTPSTGNQSYWDGDIDWYAPAEIADQIYVNSSQKKITGLGYENSSAKILPPGTVLFTSRAGIGKTAILTRKGCTNQGFQSIVPYRGELDSYFIFSRTEELKRYGELVGAGSTFVEVSGKQMAVMELMMPPTMREQQTIGGFFQQLDHLITLHQRECISFTGRADRLILTANKKRTTSSWEQRKAKEICSIGTGKSNTQDQIDDGKYPFYIRSDVPVRSNKYLYDCEAVITIGDGNIGKVFHYVNGKFDLHQRCYKMTDFKDIWGKYFFYYFSTKFNDRAMKMTAKATVDSVRLEMISEMDIKKPPQISEQKQIAEFFANLDNLITLHQRKPFLMKWRTSDANRNQTNRLVL